MKSTDSVIVSWDFSHGKDDLRIFHFEPITKISQRMPLAEFSVSANKIRFPANEAP